MRKAIIVDSTHAAASLYRSKVTIKDILIYLDKVIHEKEATLTACRNQQNNPSVKELYYGSSAVKDFAEYLKMSIKSNSPHYLK